MSKYHVYFLYRHTTSEYLTYIVYSQANTVFPLTDAPARIRDPVYTVSQKNDHIFIFQITL